MQAHLTATLLITALAGATAVAAQEIPAPDCSAPTRPARLQTQEEVNAYARLVQAYQGCLMGYAEEHKRIASSHTEAANKAVQAWNAFVASANARPTADGGRQ